MENIIYKAAKEAISEFEEALKSNLSEYSGLKNIMVNVNISISNVPVECMPDGSEQRIGGNTAWYSYQPPFERICINSEHSSFDIVMKPKN